jgi:biotin carboxyl carrier protein
MQYEIEVGGRTRQVLVERVGDDFTVTVDGCRWPVNAARIDGAMLSLLIGPAIDGSRGTAPPSGHAAGRAESREVTIAPDPASGQLIVRVGATPIMVTLNGRQRWGRRDDGGHASAGPQRVVAPMPGKVVRVLVKPGDAVRPRQGLVVIEAMKMENELRAAREGTVTDVPAKEAMSVDAGTLLVVIT